MAESFVDTTNHLRQKNVSTAAEAEQAPLFISLATLLARNYSPPALLAPRLSKRLDHARD